MERRTANDLAEEFHRLHAASSPLVLVNAWDAASARVIEAAGAAAIATTSAGMAWSLGYPDGEHVNVRDFLAACERICRVVSRPVSVDIERGYGRTTSDVAMLVGSLIDLGVVGVNIEDGVAPDTRTLVPSATASERIRAIRDLARERGVRLFINARIDTYFAPGLDPQTRYDETVRRAAGYVAAGADGVFVPGLEALEVIARLVIAVPRPLNTYAGSGGATSVTALRAAGVKRVSLGCAPLQAALAFTRRMATEAAGAGEYTTMRADMLSVSEANGLFVSRES